MAATEIARREAQMQSIPVIDVSALASSDISGRRRVAAEIGAACRGIGFFYVAGHGIAPARIDATFAAARSFFAKPVAEKAALSIERSPHNRGYVGLGGESLDPSKPADLKEAFNIGLEFPADDPEVLAGRPLRGLNQWPADPAFRAAMLAYYDAVLGLGRLIHRGFSLDLGLAEDHFAAALARPAAILRLLHYPQRPAVVAEGQAGAGEHTDYGNLTLLVVDGVAGLEVRTRDGHWLDAPHIPGTFVCNIGDCLMRWTNDVYVSTPHRVRPPDRERMSIAFFLDADPGALVEALPGCVSAERPARYPPISAGDYLAERLDATYAFRRKAV
jgi:isopenicillin N synthase-like dioxygenase